MSTKIIFFLTIAIITGFHTCRTEVRGACPPNPIGEEYYFDETDMCDHTFSIIKTCDFGTPYSGRWTTEWGKQGPKIIICDCGSIIPARGKYEIKGYEQWANACEYEIQGGQVIQVYYQRLNYLRSVEIKYHGDKDLFIGPTCTNPSLCKNECWWVTPPGLLFSLKDDNCDTLTKALGAEIEIRGQELVTVRSGAYDSSGYCLYCPCYDGGPIKIKQNLETLMKLVPLKL